MIKGCSEVARAKLPTEFTTEIMTSRLRRSTLGPHIYFLPRLVVRAHYYVCTRGCIRQHSRFYYIYIYSKLQEKCTSGRDRRSVDELQSTRTVEGGKATTVPSSLALPLLSQSIASQLSSSLRFGVLFPAQHSSSRLPTSQRVDHLWSFELQASKPSNVRIPLGKQTRLQLCSLLSLCSPRLAHGNAIPWTTFSIFSII